MSESASLVIASGDSEQRHALAAETLARGNSVAMFERTLILRPVNGELRCEVVDSTPSTRRCANEYEVLIENAQRALGTSKLAPLLPRMRQTWVVIDESDGDATEVWRAR